MARNELGGGMGGGEQVTPMGPGDWSDRCRRKKNRMLQVFMKDRLQGEKVMEAIHWDGIQAGEEQGCW